MVQMGSVRKSADRRIAFTLLEAVIAVAVLAALLAILLPAVQSARVSARTTTCRSHLHQIGVAVANFEQAHGEIPTWRRTRKWTVGTRSMWPLLPYLDQRALWEELEDTQHGSTVVDVLACPDDPLVWDVAGQVSFAYNAGTLFPLSSPAGNGVMTPRQRGTTLREIHDGLSSTALMSERLVVTSERRPLEAVTPEILRQEPRRYLWYTTRRFSGIGAEQAAAQSCRTTMTTSIPFTYGAGAQDYVSCLPQGYLHLLPPNHRACYNAVDRDDLLIDYVIVPPSSNHAGGVHVLMADGQVRFVSESISDAPWQAAGTRDGGDVAGL